MNILMWNLAQMSLTVLPTYGKKNFSVSKIPGSLNLKFTFQFDHSSMYLKYKWHFSYINLHVTAIITYIRNVK